ncbi:MAG: glycosyltransferase [Pseudomonadota bacterium]
MTIPVSVIIPLAPGEQAWRELIPQLKLPSGSEIVLAVGEAEFETKGFSVKTVSGSKGRAAQMNAAARQANNAILWFLHADSRLSPDAIAKLMNCVGENADCLWFFKLKFSDDGPSAMKWNEWAVRWRAGFLKMPFGDQGFCISKKLFEKLGGYREDLAYGEDHVFVWKVRQEGYPVMCVGTSISTSARKYRENGWFSTTLLFVSRTVWQGVPQRVLLLKRQMGRLFS